MTLLLDSPSVLTDLAGEPSRRLWTRAEYERLAEACFFDGQHVQLFQGVIYKLPPQGLPHSLAIERFDAFVRRAFPDGHRFRTQMPFYSADGSQPEPDIGVLEGSVMDPVTSHPTHARLVVEVSDTSLRFDRAKAVAYASSGVPEYWIANLTNGTVEIYREPVSTPTIEHHYKSIVVLSRSDSLSPLGAPQIFSTVNQLLP